MKSTSSKNIKIIEIPNIPLEMMNFVRNAINFQKGRGTNVNGGLIPGQRGGVKAGQWG
jgi:hypothetical protein